MDNIKDIVRGVIGQLSHQKPADEEKIENILNSVLTDSEKKHIKFVGIKEDKGYFVVTSSVWLFQINLKKNKILEKLKELYPSLKNLYFKIGKVT
jgi:hypothetical protein